MAVRRRMITDEIVCSTKFFNLHSDAQLLYFYLILYSDDDGIVDPFPVMRMTGFCNMTALEELVEREFIYILGDDMLAFVVHFHVQNTISPSKKVDSIYLERLLMELPELRFKIVVSKNRRSQNSYSQLMQQNRNLEIEPKNQNKERMNEGKNERKAEPMPEELREKLARWGYRR